MYNTIIAVGHLTADPTLRQTNTGKSICSMRMCVSDSKSQNKCFIDVESWEKTADVCAQYLSKGREVVVEGELCTSSWRGKDGSQQSKNFIRANRVKFLSSGKKDGGASSPAKENQEVSSQNGEDDVPF